MAVSFFKDYALPLPAAEQITASETIQHPCLTCVNVTSPQVLRKVVICFTSGLILGGDQILSNFIGR